MKAKLIIDFEKEVTIGEGVTTIGRASDNQIPFVHDSNVSRYHAEIETLDDEFWLIELGSSNGTKINGEIVTREKKLNNGDKILFGGTSEIEFFIEKSKVESRESKVESQESINQKPKNEDQTPNSETKKKFPVVLAVAAIACGLAIVSIFAVVFYLNMETDCKAEAKIIGAESGATLTQATQIQLELKGGNCVKQAIYMIDGEPVASEIISPFAVTINPNDFGSLADGGTHVLTVALVDDKGKKTLQPSSILLAFETAEIKSKPTPEIVKVETPTNPTEPNQTPVNVDNRQVSLADTQEMCRRLTKQFSGNFSYKFDSQFLQQVQLKTKEFASEGYFSRASQHQDAINVAFVKDNQLDASLGYFLAMSRSQFKNEKRGSNESLWQITSDFVTANGYGGVCETLNLSDKNCAAKTASLYLKNIVIKIFDGDTIYGVSAFGMTEQEANDFKSKLPADRTNFWQVIKNQKQRDEIVRFFAAGIVAENPQKFGLKRDKPIHELYDFTMQR